MRDLISYLVKESLGVKDVTVHEEQDEDRTIFVIKVPEDSVGFLIGKNGSTIKTFRKLLKIKATLDKVRVDLRVA